MEAKTRKQKAKPPENRKEANSADSNRDWRTRATVGTSVAEESDEEEHLPEITRQRKIKVAEVVADVAQGIEPVPEVPYRVVPPALSTDQERPLVNIEELHPRDERSYQVRAPVQKPGLGKEIAERVADAEITVKVGELAGVSKEIRDYIKTKMIGTRQPLSRKSKKGAFTVQEEPLPYLDDEEEPRLEYDALSIAELPPLSTWVVTTNESEGLPSGSIVISDPYVQYLEALAPGQAPKQVYVAGDSASLRVVFPKINNNGEVESVTDSGSQIVSMSYEQAVKSRLTWDPDLQIYMESANRTLEKSLGLARNISFQFGPLTVYLQVHVIRGAAYKVLLGRPFEILTESVIHNSRDGSQTLTLKDPNTGKRCSVPTHPRGKHIDSKGPERATVEEVPDEDDRQEKTADSTSGGPPKEQGFRQSSMS